MKKLYSKSKVCTCLHFSTYFKSRELSLQKEGKMKKNYKVRGKRLENGRKQMGRKKNSVQNRDAREERKEKGGCDGGMLMMVVMMTKETRHRQN